RADSLLMGCAVGLLTAGNRLQRASWLFVVNRSMLVVLLPFVGYALVTFSSVSAFLYRGGFTLVSATAAIAIIELLNAPPGLVVRVMESPPLVWVGRLSYGLYLWIFPVCYILTIPGRPRLVLVPLQVGATFAMAILSFYLIERPFLRLKEQFTTDRTGVN